MTEKQATQYPPSVYTYTHTNHTQEFTISESLKFSVIVQK